MKLTLEQLRVCYGETVALAGLDLEVASGEWLGLLGPSGSGKTSALRAIAGFERASGGRVLLDDDVVADGRTHRPPERRGVGFVFQEFALFPHLSAAQNIAFGLRHLPKDARAARVKRLLARVEMAEYADRAPSALSGGQQQRIALARALAPDPPALLMDEPFGSLDPALRGLVRERVVEALRAGGRTVVFISHDIHEAFAIADRIALLRDGVLQQIGAPEELYGRPTSAFVAGFLGPVNLIPGDAAGQRMSTALGDLRLAHEARGPRAAVVRPHMFAIDPGGVAVTVERRVFRGDRVELAVRSGSGAAWQVDLPTSSDARPGDTLRLAVAGAVWTVPSDGIV